MKNIAHLKTDRAALVSEAREALTANDNAKFDAIGKKIEETDAAIAREERMVALDNQVAAKAAAELPELREYSLVRALAGHIDGNLDGLEKEVHEELRANNVETKGLRIPIGFLTEKREITTSANIADQKFGPFLPRLTPDSIVLQAGASTLEGVGYGKIILPVQTGGPDANITWLAESGAAPSGDATYSSISLTPHTSAVFQKISRRALITNSIGLENQVRADAIAAVGRVIDMSVLGTSVTNSPVGIRGQLAEDATTETLLDLAAADLLSAVENNNGSADTFFISNALAQAARKRRTTDGLPIPLSTLLYGKQVFATPFLTGNTVIAAKASDILVAYFNKAGAASVDVTVDTSTYSSEGALKLVYFSDVDTKLKYGAGSASWATLGS